MELKWADSCAKVVLTVQQVVFVFLYILSTLFLCLMWKIVLIRLLGNLLPYNLNYVVIDIFGFLTRKKIHFKHVLYNSPSAI